MALYGAVVHVCVLLCNGLCMQGTVTWETVTLRHHGLLDSERERIQTEHRDTTQVLEVSACSHVQLDTTVSASCVLTTLRMAI